MNSMGVQSRLGGAEEMLEIFDNAGNPAGQSPRSVVHASGQWHRSVNVMVFRSDGDLLIQRRSKSKDVCPGMWDLSVAEHLQQGEDFSAAARRGLKEELGIGEVELLPLGPVLKQRIEIPNLGIRDYELQRLFLAVSDGPVVASADEIDETRYVPLSVVSAMASETPPLLTPWFRSWISQLASHQSTLNRLGLGPVLPHEWDLDS